MYAEDEKLRVIKIVRDFGVRGDRFSILGIKVASSVEGKFWNPILKKMEEAEKPAYIVRRRRNRSSLWMICFAGL